MSKNWKKFRAKKILFFLDQKLQFTHPQACIKDIQVTKEAFSFQKRTSSTSNHEISSFFLLLRVIFAFLDPDPDSENGSGSTDLIESGSNPDPDPKPWWAVPRSVEKLPLYQGATAIVQPPEHKAHQYSVVEV
jgi:hypothetical protein